MTYSNLKPNLDKILRDLGKINGVEGSLIADGNGEVLSHHILQYAGTDLFGPMAHVITSSSKRLTNVANQGEIERVLVESKKGKALFLHLGNVYFIVLMNQNANIGRIMISSKKQAEKIMVLTKDLSPIQLEEKVAEQVAPKAAKISSKEEQAIKDEKISLKIESADKNFSKALESKSVVKEATGQDSQETKAPPTIQTKELETEELTETFEETEAETLPVEEITKEEIPLKEKDEYKIPVIKPPIAFPKLEKINEIPGDMEKRADLVLNIYEAIFRAMSIGASKIMGVAPARGLTRKFLPLQECKKLLKDVDVKSNSTIDFEKIKENAASIPISERENSFIEDFTKIIDIITEKYGKVMGYAAFRGMVRPEFKIINESYGAVMDELGIREKLHPELLDLFE